MAGNDASKTTPRYGSWPLSGEIDVFEDRKNTGYGFGTLHYGAQWPNNINTSDDLIWQDGKKNRNCRLACIQKGCGMQKQ